jgi:iron(III) transport system substrate-binding protein
MAAVSLWSAPVLKPRRVLLLAALGFVAACGERPAGKSDSPSAAGGAAGAAVRADPAKGVVNLYTARHYDADQLIYDGFTRATGVKVNVRETRPDQLVERMRAEGAASPADVVLMADAGALHRAQVAGVLQPARSATLEAAIPANLRHPDGFWFGFSRRARVIAVTPPRPARRELRSATPPSLSRATRAGCAPARPTTCTT